MAGLDERLAAIESRIRRDQADLEEAGIWVFGIGREYAAERDDRVLSVEVAAASEQEALNELRWRYGPRVEVLWFGPTPEIDVDYPWDSYRIVTSTSSAHWCHGLKVLDVGARHELGPGQYGNRW